MEILPNTPEWHAERRKGIGGSDAAATLGVSKYRTPYQVYLEKIGEAGPQDETWEMARGKALEPLLRQHYANTTGRSVMIPREAMVHPKYTFMRYNPDGLSDDGRLQEFKTAGWGREWGEDGSDEIPHEYIIQVQHGMVVTQRDVADCCVSIGGNQPRYFVVEADRELQEMIIESEARFWELVISRTPPEPISNDDAARVFSKVNGQSIVTTDDIYEAFAALVSMRARLKELEENKECMEVMIKNFMRENEVLLAQDGKTPLTTWKQAKGAARIDLDLLRKEQPEIAAKYTKTAAPSRRFLVK